MPHLCDNYDKCSALFRNFRDPAQTTRSPEKIMIHVAAESLLNVLGVIYVHKPTSDGGEIYLTRFGLHYASLLELDNWYERSWFETHRKRLEGTSAVY